MYESTTTSRQTPFHPDWVAAGDSAFEIGVKAAGHVKRFGIKPQVARAAINKALKELGFVGRLPQADALSGFKREMGVA
jgi:hypothetical protein